MKKGDFVHLHLHSQYSLLDGFATFENIYAAAKKYQISAVALTDHGNLFGAIEFYQSALKAGLKPIIGYEAYIAPGKRTQKQQGISKDGNKEETSFHLTLLVKNEKGYQNLIKMATVAYLEGFYYKPRIDKELLAGHSEGLIVLSGCLKSEIAHHILQGRNAKAKEVAAFYRDIFKDDFYLELHNHGIKEQKEVTKGQLEIAKELGIPLVATNDVHYLTKPDAKVHDILLCIATNKMKNDPNRLKMSVEEFYFKSPDEMRELFKEVPDAITNTVAIADKCNLEIRFGEYHLPKFKAPDGKTSAAYLKELCEEGLKMRFGEVTDNIRKRLNFEMDVIQNMGFADYFLIVRDFVQYARSAGISVGPGRGSAAGSLLSYVAGITDIDPLKYDLLFERFMNPGRKELPDIDIDFSQEGRDEVIKYVRKKYGEDSVAQIITFGTMQARAALRDVGRVSGIHLSEVDRIAKKIPDILGITLKEALNTDKELQSWYQTRPEIKELFDISMKLEGLCRHASTHAAGVVIGDKPLTTYGPLYDNAGVTTTQYDANSLLSIGLLKVDMLGLATLPSIDNCIKIVEKTRNIKVDIQKIPLDDKATYKLLSRGESKGVFQLESAGMRDLEQKLRPDAFEDIIALIALYRPGPLKSRMVDDYIRRKHGEDVISYIHKSLEPLLKETYGVILYQEQVMRIANVIGGLNLSEADSLRKSMGKKNQELAAKYREQFVKGAVKNKLTTSIANEIYNLMEFFAGYGFNKSHSAAYAMTSYRTAYLKANYPVEYMAALLTIHRNQTDKVSEYIEECKRMEIEILPPDINESKAGFTVKENKIRFGLSAVKNVGDKAVEIIIKERDKNGKFGSFFDFCERADLQVADKLVIESFIKCGTFDSFGMHRAQLVVISEDIIKIANQKQHDKRTGQLDLLSGSGKREKDPGKKAGMDYFDIPHVPEWTEEVLLKHEKEVLGFYITGHPLVKHEKILKELSTYSAESLSNTKEDTEVKIGGIITNMHSTIRKGREGKGEKQVIFRLRDLTGAVDVVTYSEKLIKYKDLILEDKIVFVKGKIGFRQGNPVIRLNEISPLERAYEELARSVTINMSSLGLEDGTIQGVKDVLLAHPGNCPVFIYIETPEKQKVLLKANSDFSVSPSKKFIDDINELIGREHLVFNH
jgi:DNA polymerase-3 subunit alpha